LAWAKNGTPDTLSSSGDTLEVNDMNPYKFNSVMQHTLDTGGTIYNAERFSNNTSSQHAVRVSTNGGADATGVSRNDMTTYGDPESNPMAMFGYFINIDGEEKLFIGFGISQKTAGASTAPSRRETVGKFAVTSGQATVFGTYNGGTGDYNTNSNISILGTD